MRVSIQLRTVCAFTALALVTSACASAPRNQVVIDGASRPLPAFALADADLVAFKETITGFRGKPVVVNLWASWCGPCRAEAPLLERAAVANKGKVQFLGVSTRDDRQSAATFLERFAVSYPNLVDSSGDIRKYLGLRGLPTTYVFDSKGRLVSQVIGGISEQSLAARLEDARHR